MSAYAYHVTQDGGRCSARHAAVLMLLLLLSAQVVLAQQETATQGRAAFDLFLKTGEITPQGMEVQQCRIGSRKPR